MHSLTLQMRELLEKRRGPGLFVVGSIRMEKNTRVYTSVQDFVFIQKTLHHFGSLVPNDTHI